MNKAFAILAFVGLMAFFVFPVFAKIGDINGDGKVDLTDLVILANAYGSHPGQPNWDARCDLTNDGVVGLSDVATIGVYYGT